jgi:hypothetical protein
MARLEFIEWEGNMSHFEVTVKSVDADVECAFVLPGLDASFWLGERPRHQLDLADHALQEVRRRGPDGQAPDSFWPGARSGGPVAAGSGTVARSNAPLTCYPFGCIIGGPTFIPSRTIIDSGMTERKDGHSGKNRFLQAPTSRGHSPLVGPALACPNRRGQCRQPDRHAVSSRERA